MPFEPKNLDDDENQMCNFSMIILLTNGTLQSEIVTVWRYLNLTKMFVVCLKWVY